jgi:hypothetical protein
VKDHPAVKKQPLPLHLLISMINVRIFPILVLA